ncbi:hypothetical protein OF377_00710 [Ureaplasma sp. ES3154-GEN]|uniref:hypothetical protein n=1 Tax=Ureaplasma sp. ES3154-GEN TaxID=2984844 RepID=UPI0021E70917|nr:hypothetical protein [Ureaplasma sp. ES3154-GEN]MCV3743408.1 hypothetical protein [Ureaplasma sp. ES3154-GEN]
MEIRIDLHTHTTDSNPFGSKVTNTDDNEIMNVLKYHKIDIVCFSDHYDLNIKKYEQRVLLGKQYKPEIIVWPGIEVDITSLNKNKKAQVVIVFDPHQDIQEIRKFCRNNFKPWKNQYFKSITYKQLVEKLADFNCLIIPHVGKARDEVSVEDLIGVRVDALDTIDLDHKNVLKMRKKGILAPEVYFSDTHDWNNYPQHSYYYTKLEVEDCSFNSVKKAITANKINPINKI